MTLLKNKKQFDISAPAGRFMENLPTNHSPKQQENGQASRMNMQEHTFGKNVATQGKTDGASYKLNSDNSITKTVNGKDYVVSTADYRYQRVNQEMRDAVSDLAAGAKNTGTSYKLNEDRSIAKTVNGKDYVVGTADRRYNRVQSEILAADGGNGSVYNARKDQDEYLSSGKNGGKSGKQDYSDVEVRITNVSQGNDVSYDSKTRKIYITTPEGYKTVLQYGKDYYIGSDKMAYYKNDKTKAIIAVGENNNNTWAISQDGSTIRNKLNNYRLYEGQDYYIGSDGVAYFYNDVRIYNTARGVDVAWSGDAIHLKSTDGRTYELKEGSNFYFGADGKAHYFNGPPSPNPAYWEEADDDADPDWLDEDKIAASSNGAGFIANYEGFRGKAYRGQDSVNLTIGYGHVIRPGENYDNGITQEEALSLLEKDMGEAVASVTNFLVENEIEINQNQFDALVSFTYNTGPNVWDNKSTLRTILKSGIYTPEQITDAFTRWVKVKKADGTYLNSAGLWHRRMDEAELFLFGDYATNTSRKAPAGYQ